MEMVKLTIDNKQVEVPKGTTIYKAAKQVGIDIPTLCYMDLQDLNIEHKPGGCRICVVEVEGRRNLAPACCYRCQRRNGCKNPFDPGTECTENSDGTDSLRSS